MLDIGSGWGGLALSLAEAGAGEVLGVTLSEHQLEVARERARRRGLADRVRFDLRDYRELDRDASIASSRSACSSTSACATTTSSSARCSGLLSDDGVAVLHSIGRMDGPAATNPWMRKYIFPGGYSPALSEVLPAIERQGLWVTDVEILRLHYAETLRDWRAPLRRQPRRDRPAVRRALLPDVGVLPGRLRARLPPHGPMVFQMQLAKRQDAVPLTRDYISDWERGHLDGAIAAE